MSEKNKKRILIVDDTPANLDILVDALGDAYSLTAATDGVQALEEIQQEMPDLILLDILMPEMDGYQVCQRLNKDPATRNIPVIFVTSLTDEVDETRGFDLGGVDYITKPFSISVVRARVRTHLELAEARKDLERQNDILKDNIRLREQVEQVTRHDLKNPLQILLGYAQLLNATHPIEHEEVRDMAKGQVEACHTMLNMINRSLDLYRLENGSYTLSLSTVDIISLLEKILLGCKRLITPMGLGVEIYMDNRPAGPGDRFELRGDEPLLYAMISNLVTNALEASRTNDIVKIFLSREQGPQIIIENRGTVPEAIRDKFFEKFVTAGKAEGTGLGTYSAWLSARRHGGNIALFTSDRDDLTRITVCLTD